MMNMRFMYIIDNQAKTSVYFEDGVYKVYYIEANYNGKKAYKDLLNVFSGREESFNYCVRIGEKIKNFRLYIEGKIK